MKKEFNLFTFLALVVIIPLSEVRAQTTPRIMSEDSVITIATNEAGITMRIYYYNSFAPEWYLKSFCFNLCPGIVYKKEEGRSGFRLGYMRADQTLTSYGGGWMKEEDSHGLLSGSIFYGGVYRQFYHKGRFVLFAGADISYAKFSFIGKCASYDGRRSFEESKKSSAIGLNPFTGVSLTLFSDCIKISLETSFDNWRIQEKNKITDPDKVIVKHLFVSSPNPISAFTVSARF